jgi:hypothetical protein
MKKKKKKSHRKSQKRKRKKRKKKKFQTADPVFGLTLSLNTTGHRAQVLCIFFWVEFVIGDIR